MEDVLFDQHQEGMEGNEGSERNNNEERSPLLPRGERQPTYHRFRDGREEQGTADKCTTFVLAVLKFCFCSLGLWGHQAWNYILRVLVTAICIYQAAYDFYVVLSCRGFDCGFLQNTTDEKPPHHKDHREIANAVYTIVSLGALISYITFIGCFIIAKRKDSALVPPSETLMDDLDRKDAWCLYFAFVLITALCLCSAVVFYAIIRSQPRNSDFYILVTGVASQFFAQWTAITTCHVFAVSSFTLGTIAKDALRLIQDLQNRTLDDIIILHEDLCTVVFSTVSAYSVWFVLHWFTYGAGVVLSVIYLSKEFLYGNRTLNLVYLCLFFVFHLYLFLLPCLFAAKITSCCTGIYEDINCTTSVDWSEGHPFKDRRNLTMFVSYAKKRRCGFKIGRITFSSASAWVSVFLGLLGLLFSFF